MIVSVKKLKQTNWMDEEPPAEETEPISLEFVGSSFENCGLSFPRQPPIAQGGGKTEGLAAMAWAGLRGVGGNPPDDLVHSEKEPKGEDEPEKNAARLSKGHCDPLKFPAPAKKGKGGWGWLALSFVGHLAVAGLVYGVIAVLFQSSFLTSSRSKEPVVAPRPPVGAFSVVSPVASGAQGAQGTLSAPSDSLPLPLAGGDQNPAEGEEKRQTHGGQKAINPAKDKAREQRASPVGRTAETHFILPSGQIVHMLDLSEIPEVLFKGQEQPSNHGPEDK